MKKIDLAEAKIIFKRMKKNRRLHNTLISLFLFIFLGGYLFFFTSNALLSSNQEADAYSDQEKTYYFLNREINIISWTYSMDQKLMEAVLEIKNLAFDGVDAYKTEAVERKKGNLQTKQAYQDASTLVVQIEDVPKNFTEVSLRIELQDKDAGSEEDSSDVLKLYNNFNRIEKVKEIKTGDKAHYAGIKLKKAIKKYEEESLECQEQMQALEEKIKNAKQFIADQQKERPYQIEGEDNTEQLIQEAKSEIKQSQESMEDLKTKIEENDLLILQIKEKIEGES